jgi:hypothetical protein
MQKISQEFTCLIKRFCARVRLTGQSGGVTRLEAGVYDDPLPIKDLPMTDNALPLLNQVLEAKKQAVALDMKLSDHFELFAAQHVLRDYQIGDDDIEVGLVGTDEEDNKEGSDG